MKKNVYNDIPDISQDILKTNLKKITDHINKEVDKIYGSEKIVNEEIKLTYKINEHGFRTHSMENIQNPCWLALGCSNTFGMGNPEELRWSNLLEKKYDTKIYNLGAPGGGTDTVFRLALGWIDIIKPEKILVLWPPIWRKDLIFEDDNKKAVRSFQGKVVLQDSGNYFLRTYFLHDENSIINFEKNSLALQQLCNERNIELVTLHAPVIGSKIRHSENDTVFARDGKHLGKDYQQEVADSFCKEIE